MYKATITVELDDSFMETLVDMAGYGIAYWAQEIYLHTQPETVSGVITVTPHEEFIDEFPAKTLDYRTLAWALQEIAKGGIVNSYLTEYARNVLLGENGEPDAGNIDSELADVVVQYAMFQKIVFG